MMLRTLAAIAASALAAAALSVGAALAETHDEPAPNAKKAAHKAAFWCPLHLADEKQR
jgi:Spy/CpxP family protein refolding chaperone